MELDLVPPDELRGKYVQAIREYKPDILVSEDCMYLAETHPDHRVVARLANEAVTFANLPLLYPEQLKSGLEPHFTPEKYFYTEDIEAANHIVDISLTFEDKMAALLEHESQVKFLVEDIFRQAKMAGIDLKVVLGDAVNDHRSAMDTAMRLKAVEVGSKVGFKMGEAFRITRFHPVIENMLNKGS
jgi:LmbE family N-acetylglucosaminyl deacetylase